MTTIDELFPRRALRADDVTRPTNVTIESFGFEDVAGRRKPVLRFKKARKFLVLVPTVARQIAALHGDVLEDWAGKRIQLVPATTTFQGQRVACIRVEPAGVAGGGHGSS